MPLTPNASTLADLAGSTPTADLDKDANNKSLIRTAIGLGNVDNTSDADKPVSTATQTALDAKVGFNPSAMVVVDPTGSDTDRGTALAAAYTAAKALTPNGAAISALNRSTVVIPPGKYKLSATLTLDAEFVDLVALTPTKPSRRDDSDNDDIPELGASNLPTFRPGPTLVYFEDDLESTIEQTADNVRLHGFSVAHLGDGTGLITENLYVTALDWGAFIIGQGCDNADSLYTDMYFWASCVAYLSVGAVRAYENFSGTWINCVANSASFRCGYGDKLAPSAVFSAKMYDCEAGPFSFIGDFPSGRKANYSAQNAHFERCKSVGLSWEGGPEYGAASFAGCSIVATEIESTCEFVDCVSGYRSFGIGNDNAGTFIRCRAGKESFGATSGSTTEVGNFSGYAEDCFAGADSFGGTTEDGYGKCSGTLVRCTGAGNTKSMRIEGATIRNSRITSTTTGVHTMTLLDSSSVISGTDIIVLQGGTGIPVYASTAKNVAAYHCRMNNASNDADGLGSNVTNLVSSAGNIISNSVQ